MLQRLFAALEDFPSHFQSPPWLGNIFLLLSGASKESMTPISLKLAREVVVQGIPTVLRKRKLISFALGLGQSAVLYSVPWDHFDLSERPFVKIDKVMLELWSEQEGGEGRTEENLLKWKEFRLKVMKYHGIDLATLNGHLPTWIPHTARTGPSRLDRFLSVLGIDRVRVPYISFHPTFLPAMY